MVSVLRRFYFDFYADRNKLTLGGAGVDKSYRAARVRAFYNLFPFINKKLSERAGVLSGGEQQMLALARAMISRPKLLLLDEPSIGLSPDYVDLVFNTIVDLARDEHIAVVMVEQKVHEALRFADRVIGLRQGKVAFNVPANTLEKDSAQLKDLFLW